MVCCTLLAQNSHVALADGHDTVMTVYEHTAAANLYSCVVARAGDETGSALSLLGVRLDCCENDHAASSFVAAFTASYAAHMAANGFVQSAAPAAEKATGRR